MSQSIVAWGTDRIPTRGQRGPSPIGTTVFATLRVLDALILQRMVQVANPVTSLYPSMGWTMLPPSPSGWSSPPSLTSYSLTPFQAVLWSMSICSAAKQIYWLLFVTKEPMPVNLALLVSLLSTFLHTINNLAFSLAANNPTWTESAMYTAVPLFMAGILIEGISEMQRRRFKDDLRNEGKPYSAGLFRLARSINYLGFAMWQGAFALAGGGWVWGAFVTLFFSLDFAFRAIPHLDRYCTKRYGSQWGEVKRKVPYCFCPGLY